MLSPTHFSHSHFAPLPQKRVPLESLTVTSTSGSAVAAARRPASLASSGSTGSFSAPFGLVRVLIGHLFS